MRNPRRWTGAGSLALLAALALAACGGDGGGGGGAQKGAPADGRGAAGQGEPVRGGTAIVSSSLDIEKPMPLVWSANFDADIVDVLYMGLLRPYWHEGRLHFKTADQSPMALARSYEFLGPDSTSIRFRMRSGARWSDGQPITARDVRWTAERMKDPAVASPRQTDVQFLDSVQVENDTTVTLHFSRRYPDMLFNAAFGVAPEHVFRGVAPGQIRTHPSLLPGGEMVISGPFRLTRWRPGAEFSLERNPHGTVQPRLDRIAVRVVPDQTVQLGELQAGRVDMVTSVPLHRVAELRRSAPFVRLESMDKRFIEYVAWNPRTVPAFADPEIREALNLAVDNATLVRSLGIGEYAVPATGPYPPIFPQLSASRTGAPGADTARARRILEAKGWRDTDGDGIREKDGRPFRVTLETNSGNQRRADAGQILQRQFREIGVDVQLRTLEFATQQDRLRERRFEAALGSWGVQLSPDITQSYLPEGGYNVVSYDDPPTTRLLQQAASASTEAQALPLWRAAADRIMQRHPYTWLYYYDLIVGVNQRLRGTDIDTFGIWQNPWEWWIPTELQAGPQATPRPR